MSDRTFTDADRLKFLEETARTSRTGISFDWSGSIENVMGGYRFMSRHNVGKPHNSIREAIDTAINERGWRAK